MPETYLTVQVFKFNMCVLQNQDKASVGHINLSCKRSPLSLCVLLVLVILCVFCCKQFLCINFKTWCWIINTCGQSIRPKCPLVVNTKRCRVVQQHQNQDTKARWMELEVNSGFYLIVGQQLL